MILRDRRLIIPGFLLLCLLVGGSAQVAWSVMVLQLLAIALLAWVALDRGKASVAVPQARRLWLLVGLALVLVLLQLVPLPPAVWATLPGRAAVAADLRSLGLAPSWMPLSLAPYATISTVIALLPPIAIIAVMLRLGFRPAWIALAVIAAAIGGTLLGLLQMSGPASPTSPWYLYSISNFGKATGFFANSNHMATLLLSAVPFVGALWVTSRSWDDVRKRIAARIIVVGATVVLLAGIAVNGSLAGYGLVVPVVVATMLLIVRPRAAWVQAGTLGIGLAGLIAFAELLFSPLRDWLPTAGAGASMETRQMVATRSADLFDTYSVTGSGLGTYADVYRMVEDPGAVDRTFVNHAHNDYLELAVELGLPGVLLMLAFLLWWGSMARALVRSPLTDQFAAAGAVSSAAILAHSLVDYPLRTAAVGALFAVCLGLMLASRRKVGSRTDLRPARHLVIQ